MTATKLAIADKQEIARLYRETDASTTQLAKQYGISSSTVLRLIQELLTPDEYREVAGRKQARAKRAPRGRNALPLDLDDRVNQLTLMETQDEQDEQDDPGDARSLDRQVDGQVDGLRDELRDLSEENVRENPATPEEISPEDLVRESEVEDIVDDEFDDTDLEEGDEDDDGDEEESNEEDESDYGEESEYGDDVPFVSDVEAIDPTSLLSILPLDTSALPDTCYIVVDKASEIVTRPLRDFKDLGKIPPEESQSRTLPIFDNHRIARRFSDRNHRIVKFPGDLIYITHNKLAEKGITRMIYGGRVYTLQ